MKNESFPSVERLRHLLTYDDAIGALRWRVAGRYARGPKAIVVGGLAAKPSPKGYRRINVDGVEILEHIAIWAIVRGEYPGRTIDHHDGRRSNNRLGNLRLADMSQQSANSPARDGRVLPRNIYLCRKTGRYQVDIQWMRDGARRRYSARFANLDEAIEAARRCHLGVHGEYSFYARPEQATLALGDAA